MTTLSNNRTIINGDIDTGRGQLGIGWAGTATAGPLWSLRSGANHYAMTSATTITLVLPDVGTGATQAQPGYWFTVRNTGTNTITFNNFAGATINALAGGVSAMYIAVATSFASSNWVVQYDTTTYGAATTLQQAYNASGTATPQITLSSTNGAVKIQDAATPIGAALFSISDSVAANIFRIGNSTNSTNAGFFGGTSTGLRSFAVGTGSATGANSVLFGSGTASSTNQFVVGPSTASGAGSTILSDASFTGTYSGTGVFYQLYNGGSWAYSGGIQEGTTKTSPNRRTLYSNNNGITVAGSPITLFSFTGTVGTTYSLRIVAYGRDAVTASTVSATHFLDALVVFTGAGVGTVISQQLRTIETAGYTTTTSNAVLSINTTNVVLTLNAPDNVSGGSATGLMDYRVVTEYSSLSE